MAISASNSCPKSNHDVVKIGAAKKINFKKVFDKMEKPAFIFDGRKILNEDSLKSIGFNTYEIGK